MKHYFLLLPIVCLPLISMEKKQTLTIPIVQSGITPLEHHYYDDCVEKIMESFKKMEASFPETFAHKYLSDRYNELQIFSNENITFDVKQKIFCNLMPPEIKESIRSKKNYLQDNLIKFYKNEEAYFKDQYITQLTWLATQRTNRMFSMYLGTLTTYDEPHKNLMKKVSPQYYAKKLSQEMGADKQALTLVETSAIFAYWFLIKYKDLFEKN